MLQVKNIHKQYKTGELVQDALHDVSLNLRDNEFVAVLGPRCLHSLFLQKKHQQNNTNTQRKKDLRNVYPS